MLILLLTYARAAGITARRPAATDISAAGLRALADGLRPPLSAVGLRDGHDVNFMNELFTHMTHFASITSSSTIIIRTFN